MDPKLITPVILVALVAWGIYRRMRRSFGRQRIEPSRMLVRIALFAIIGALAFVVSVRNTRGLGGLVAGLVCGAALAYVGLRHTKFEVTPEGRFYTPHTYIGVGVMVVFLARVLYRVLYALNSPQAMAAANQNFAAAYQRSPLTIGLFAALIGYYVLFYSGVLLKNRAQSLPVGVSTTE